MNSENIQDDIPEITDELINKELKKLIKGLDCQEPKAQSLIQGKEPNIIYATDGSVIDAKKQQGYIKFFGDFLRGGIYDEKSNTYKSDDLEITYTLNDTTLEIKTTCFPYKMTILNFDKNAMNFGINLSNNPNKELGICISTDDSMKKYVEAFKEIVPYIAKHIFANKTIYNKLTFTAFGNEYKSFYLNIFYDATSFEKSASSMKITKTNPKMINYALIKTMKTFTKDNKLKKEILLIIDSDPKDMGYPLEKMRKLTTDLNSNIIKGDDGCKDNCVKVHIFALNKGLEMLKEIASSTGGNFYEIDNILDFKKNILILCNDGKDVDSQEYVYEAHYSKAHKMYDPDNPDDNPPNN